MNRLFDSRILTSTEKFSIEPFIEPAILRIQKDLEELADFPPTIMQLERLTSYKYNIVITPAYGFFKSIPVHFEIIFGSEYPFAPPNVICLSEIYHPNITWDGKICLNILRLDWNPVLSFSVILWGLLILLVVPEAEEPLDKEAARCMVERPEDFAKRARDTKLRKSINEIV